MSITAFSHLVSTHGGLRSQDGVLLDDKSPDNVITDANSRNKKCTVVRVDMMSSETWKRVCKRCDRPDMLKYSGKAKIKSLAPSYLNENHMYS